MKQIQFILIIILSATLFFGCSNDNSKSSAKEDTSNSISSSSSGDSTYTGDNSLAYSINGNHTSIKDFMHDGDGKNWMALFLNEVKNNTSTGMVKVNVTNELTKEVFDFTFANSGTTSVLHYSPSLANQKGGEATYMTSTYKNYYGDSVTVNITAISATRVSGKFSGKFLSDDDKPVPLEITDGSFDVAFTKDN